MGRFVVAAGVVSLVVSAGCKSPEEKLAANLEEMTEILEEHAEEPEDGITAMREYMHDNLPDMVENATELMVELDEAESTSDRNDRLDEIVEALSGPGEKLFEAGTKFAEAAGKDEGARDLAKDMLEQFGALEAIAVVMKDGGGESKKSRCIRVFDNFIAIISGDENMPASAVEGLKDDENRRNMMRQCKSMTDDEIDCALEAETMEELSKCN